MKAAFTPALVRKAERWAILTVALMVGISVVATLWISGSSLVENIRRIPMHAVWVLVAATVVQNLLRFARYYIAAQAMHLHVPWYRHLYYFVVGFAMIPTPGKIGMAIRLWLLRQYHGLPYSRTAPLMVMDLVSDAIAMLALVSLSLLVLHDSRLHTLGVLAVTGLVMGTLLALVAPGILRRVLKITYGLSGKRKPRLFARLLGMVRTLSQVFGLRIMGATIGLSFVAWGLYGVAVAYLIQGFGITSFGMAQGNLAMNLSNIGGFLSMMPAGIGGAEVSLGGVFNLFDVPMGVVVLAVVIIRLVDVWLPVLVGFLLLPIAIRNAPKANLKSARVIPLKIVTTTTVE